MSLSSSGLKSAMISAVRNKTEGTQAMDALGDAISKYLNDNNAVTFAWVGVGPPPASAPDPVVVCQGKVSVVAVKLTQSKSKEPSVAQAKLGLDIVAGVSKGTFTTDSSAGFSCGSGSLALAPTIAALSINITGPSMDEAYNQIAGQVVSWFKGLKPTAPLSGAHGSFTGTATLTAIS